LLKDTARSAAGGARGARLGRASSSARSRFPSCCSSARRCLLLSLGRLQGTHPGFESRGVASAYVSLADSRYTTGSQQANFFAQFIARLEALPQVKSAAIGYDVPLTGFQARTTYVVGGQPVLPPGRTRPRTGSTA